MALVVTFAIVSTIVLLSFTSDFPLALAKAQPAWGLPVNLAIMVGFITSMTWWYLFPDGRLVPSAVRFLIPVSLLWLIASLFYPQLVAVNLPLPVQLVVIVPLAICLVVGQSYRYFRVASSIQRQQIKWVVFAITVFVPVSIISNLLSVIVPGTQQPGLVHVLYIFIRASLLLAVAFPVPIAILFSVLRYRLWDADLSINRSLVYGLLTVALAASFLILFGIAQIILGALLGSQNSAIAVALAAAVTALLFNPTRQRVRNIIDRHVYGFRFDRTRVRGTGKSLPSKSCHKVWPRRSNIASASSVKPKPWRSSTIRISSRVTVLALPTALPTSPLNLWMGKTSALLSSRPGF